MLLRDEGGKQLWRVSGAFFRRAPTDKPAPGLPGPTSALPATPAKILNPTPPAEDKTGGAEVRVGAGAGASPFMCAMIGAETDGATAAGSERPRDAGDGRLPTPTPTPIPEFDDWVAGALRQYASFPQPAPRAGPGKERERTSSHRSSSSQRRERERLRERAARAAKQRTVLLFVRISDLLCFARLLPFCCCCFIFMCFAVK